jgi:hypothetical protein
MLKLELEDIQTNWEYDLENKLIIHNEDKHFPIRNLYEGFPKVTGIPDIVWQQAGYFVKRSIFQRNRPLVGIHKTPKNCAIKKIINHPIRKFGALQLSILGGYGEGKTNLLNFLSAVFMAGRHRLLMWDDSTFEARTIAGHGYFDKNWKFHPFKIFLWIPKGYTFDTNARYHNPLWNHRNNVTLMEFSNLEEIIDNLLPHKLNVVYSEAFDPASSLRIWVDLIKKIRKEVTIDKSYIFTINEFADLFPESAQKEIYHLIEEAKVLVKRFRKDRLGILTAFHELSDVTYKISRKFNYILQKKPVNKRDMNGSELAARAFTKSDVNISVGGYWRKHRIGKFPEMLDKYRIQPNSEPWCYDGECRPSDKAVPSVTTKVNTKQMGIIWTSWINKESLRTTAIRANVSYHVTRSLFKQFEETSH